MIISTSAVSAGILLLSAAASPAGAAPNAPQSIPEMLLASHIDLMTLFLVLGLGLWGAYSGAVRQISNLIAIVIGYLGAGPLSTKIAPTLGDWTRAPIFLVTVACCVIGFFVIYGVSYIVIRMILKRLVPEGEDGFINRSLGFLMGGGKALLFVFVILSAMVLIEPGVRAHWDRFPQEAKYSRAYRFSRENSIFARITQFQTLQTVMLASGPASDPRAADAKEQLRNDPDLMSLAKDTRIAALAGDPEIQKALFSGNYATLFANEKVRELLEDRELFDELGRVKGIILMTPPAEEENPAPPAPIVTVKEGRAHGGTRAADIDSL